jgi:uncharacterized protein YqhQ
MLPILESGEETLVGGQAVMEGVMMRAPHSYCVAVRKPSGEIVTEEMPVSRMSEKHPLFKYPVLRGLGVLGQAMQLGMKALTFSANAALDDGSALVSPDGRSADAGAAGKDSAGNKEMPKWMMYGQVAFSVLFFIALYKLVPLILTGYVTKWVPALNGQILSNLVDGVIRMVLFVAFLLLLCRSKDIRRTFEYHGAEHKVVFNFEARTPVTVENAQKFTTFHPRCGTSFMFVIMFISMLVYMAVPVQGFAQKFALRVAMLPVITGLSYELIRFAAKRQGSFMAMLTAPGLWIQRITTQPPSNEQAEVAIKALDGAMQLENAQGGELVIA